MPLAMSIEQCHGQKTCHQYLRTGHCKYGNTCKYGYSHSTTGQPRVCTRSRPLTKSNTLCHKYARGVCKHGLRCWFTHGDFPWPLPPDVQPPRPAAATDTTEAEVPAPSSTATPTSASISTLCLTCCDGPAEVAYSGCGHMTLCKACHASTESDEHMAASLRRCPVCRAVSSRIIIWPAGMPI